MNLNGPFSLRRSSFRCTGFLLLLVLAFFTTSSFATSPNIVISQVYGGGGNSGAPLNADYIELFNRGTVPVSINGWSLQYASATGTGNFGSTATQITELPNVTIAPGQYYLVQEASGAAGAALPTPDLTDATAINMSGTGGKVALVNTTASLGCNGGSTPCSAAALATIVDLVGYDGANFFEGAAAAPALSNTTAAFRANFGCNDTDVNSVDFTAAAPAPRNTASATHPCTVSTNPSGVGSATPSTVDPGQSTLLKVIVTPGTSPTSTGLAVVVDLTGIGGSAAQSLNDQGGNVFTYNATIPGNTSEGAKNIPVTITDSQARTGSAVISLTVNPPPPPEVAIHTLQGNSTKAPADYLNKKISTTGIVTGLKSNGFFMQSPDSEADADPETSEGLFVFTSSAPPATAALGNLVKVTGTLVEFPASTTAGSLTEIGTPSITLLSTGNALPSPATITAADTAPNGSPEQLERYESMRVHIDSLTTVSGTSGSASGANESNGTGTSNGLFFGVITGIARPFREPGVDVTLSLPPGMPANVPVWDSNPERLRVESDALVGGPLLNITSNVVMTNLNGILDFGTGIFTLDMDPLSPPTVSASMIAVPVSIPGARDFTVASFNMQRFYDTVDDAGGDVVLTAAAFDRRVGKVSLAVRNVLRYPDIVGVEEVEHLSTLQAIAARISSDAVAAGDPDPQYTAYLEEGNDPSKINVGVLIKAGRVEYVNHEQIGADARFSDPRDGSSDILNDRPSLIVRVKLHPPVGQPFPLTVVVNHLRSLTDVDTVGGTGDYTRTKRTLQAQMLAEALQQLQSGGERIVSVGDYNAFEFNDGYVDTIGTITGAPAPADQVLIANTDAVDPNLTDLVSTLPPVEQYSYIENGSAQTLDHIIVSQDMLTRPYHLEVARNNADFPVTLRNDGTRSERVSDHDIPVGYFAFPPPSADLSVAMSAASTSVLSGHLQSYTITVTNNGSDPAANATLVNTIPAHASFYSLTAASGWTCTTPVVGGTGQISCGVANLAAGASAEFTLNVVVDCATLDGTSLSNTALVSSDYDDPNLDDNTATSSTNISNPPPVISGLTVDRTVLSPPNHKMVPIFVSYSISDNCDVGLLATTKVASNQPLNGTGDGDTAFDWQVVDAHHVNLRAERAPTPEGRTYTITVSTKDSGGNSASESVTVNVPR